MINVSWKNNVVAAAVMALGICTASQSEAQVIQTITSGTFNYYMGATGTNEEHNVWSTIGQTQTLPTGGFTLVVGMNPNSQMWSYGGPSFINGVIGAYDTDRVSGYISSGGNVFYLSTSMAYSGPAPLDAAANPNYQLTYVITSISIYGAAATNAPLTLNWNEVQNNVHSQSPQSIPSGSSNWQTAAGYTNVVWDAGSYTTSVASYDNGLARYFTLSSSDSESIAIDGFQITGYATLSYTAVPEPSTVWLVAAAGIGVIFFLNRRLRKMPVMVS